MGELVADVCADLEIDRSTPWRWARDDEDFRNAYARAREDQAHALAEQAMQVAAGNDDLTAAWELGIEKAADELVKTDPRGWRQVVHALESNIVQRNRLRVDTIKWLTSKIAPRLYGERMELAGTGEGGALVLRIVRE